MLNSKQVLRLITRLNRLTQSGELKWGKSASFGHKLVEQDVNSAIYSAKLENTTLIIYRSRVNSLYSQLFEPEVVRTNQVVLEILDQDGDNVAEFIGTPGLNDLFDAVRQSTSQIERHLASLLAEELTSNASG
jgi:hypothetical protein